MVVETLKEIKTLVEELDYEVELDLISEGKSADMLSIDLLPECDLDQKLSIMIYPQEDVLDGSVLIQFFSEYSFGIASPEPAYKACSVLNRGLSLGHFRVSEDEKHVQYRYMLTFPRQTPMNALFMNDILDMAIYAIAESVEPFKALC